MTLFAKVPDDFFKILTTKHRILYLQVLFQIDDLMHGFIYVSRDQVVENLQLFFLENDISPLNINEEEFIEIKSHRALAQSVLRELEKKGWIRISYENPRDEQISFPKYANRLIELFKELEDTEEDVYSRFVFSTYSSLKIGLEMSGSEWTGLDSAWKATRDLQRVLQNTYFELNEIYNEVLNNLTTNDILSQHFDMYKDKIIDQVLFPLKTNDSIPRFKYSILKLVDTYSSELIMERMVEQLQKKTNKTATKNPDEFTKKIREHLNSISEFYSDISGLLNTIDQKTQEYTTKSIGKIQYRLRSDFQLKGTIDSLIRYTKLTEEEEFSFFELTDYGFISSDSLYTPRKIKTDISNKERIKISSKKAKRESSAETIELLRKLVNPHFSGRNVDKFVMEKLGKKKKIASDNFSIENYETFILTLMGAIRGYDKNTKLYHVIFTEQQIRNGSFELPLFYFAKR